MKAILIKGLSNKSLLIRSSNSVLIRSGLNKLELKWYYSKIIKN